MPSRERIAAYAAAVAVGMLAVAGMSVLFGSEPTWPFVPELLGAFAGALFMWCLGPLDAPAKPDERDVIGRQVLAEALETAKTEVVVTPELESKIKASFWRRLYRKSNH
jgi:hypothetical protein